MAEPRTITAVCPLRPVYGTETAVPSCINESSSSSPNPAFLQGSVMDIPNPTMGLFLCLASVGAERILSKKLSQRRIFGVPSPVEHAEISGGGQQCRRHRRHQHPNKTPNPFGILVDVAPGRLKTTIFIGHHDSIHGVECFQMAVGSLRIHIQTVMAKEP
jgi:hypothetical protein